MAAKIVLAGPKFRRPELLQHPPIPQWLYKRNPRSILGEEWWDKKRKKAYAGNNHFCWACGGGGDTILHAHEAYDYDFESRIARLEEIVGLCIPCHQFVHLAIEYQKRGPSKDFMRIMNRGLSILEVSELEPNWLTKALAYKFQKRKDWGRPPLYVAVEQGFITKQRLKVWKSMYWCIEVKGQLYGLMGEYFIPK